MTPTEAIDILRSEGLSDQAIVCRLLGPNRPAQIERQKRAQDAVMQMLADGISRPSIIRLMRVQHGLHKTRTYELISAAERIASGKQQAYDLLMHQLNRGTE